MSTSVELDKQILEVEQREAEAILRGDYDALERMWSDNLVIKTTANLILNKAQVMAVGRANIIELKSFVRRTLRVDQNGDVFIANGNDTYEPINGTDAGKTVFCSYMNVWIREGGELKLLARHLGVISSADAPAAKA